MNFNNRFFNHIALHRIEYRIYSGDERIVPFVYLSTKKVATTSITSTLMRAVCNGGGSITIGVGEDIFEKGLGDLSNHIKFTFVRNPYDRLVSAYTFFKRRNSHRFHMKSFDIFMNNYVKVLPALLSGSKGSRYRVARHIQEQYKYVEFSLNDMYLNYVYRFEDLPISWERCCKNLGAKCFIDLPKKRYTANMREYQSYKDYYGKGHREIVEEIYARDLELLGYVF